MTQQTETQDPAPSGGDLGGLLSEVEALEGAQAVKAEEQQADQQAQEIASAAVELLECLKLVRAMAAPMMAWWPDYFRVWTDAALKAIADNGAIVMQRNGWTMGDVWVKFGPYIGLIGAVLPPSLITWQAIQQRRAELRRQQPQGQPEDAEGVRP